MGDLYRKLIAYKKSDMYGFHMPGHKRNARLIEDGLPFEIDITEIEGFDDLHHAKGILKDSMEKTASLFHAEESWFLINGSTVGILSAILGSTTRGGKILVGRNCHKSVYHAIFLNELTPIYLYPPYQQDAMFCTEISAESVRLALEKNPDVQAVVLVSPTYEGVCSDIGAIAKVVHARKLPLIVDEAHGAHFGFHPYFPERANDLGADLVIQSLHKTLPSLTQTALLHINGTLVKRFAIHHYLDILQTSSPSYVLMTSIDSCVDYLKREGKNCFASYAETLKQMRERLSHLHHLRLISLDHQDPSKLVISTIGTCITGNELYEKLLRDYHLQMEMRTPTYVLAMTSPGDTEEGFSRLCIALEEIDANLTSGKSPEILFGEMPKNEICYSEAELEKESECLEKQTLRFEECDGYISMEYAYLYPPGIPLVVPGERISQEAARIMKAYQEAEFPIEGLENKGTIEVAIHE